MNQVKYNVVDKSANKIVDTFTNKMEAKELRNQLQSKTKKGLPTFELKEDPKTKKMKPVNDGRPVDGNWSYKVVTVRGERQ